MYPENRELKRLQGLSAIKLGRRLEGARMVVRTIAPGEDISGLAGIVEIFYEEAQYADIVDLLARRNLSGDRYLMQIYGIALSREKKCAQAVVHLSEAIRLGAGDLDTRLYRGLCLEEMGRLDEAIADFEEAYRIDPVRKDVQQALARAYRKAKRFEQAAKLMRRGIR
jgi:tetratricopeptide (TPR) repeat protein